MNLDSVVRIRLISSSLDAKASSFSAIYSYNSWFGSLILCSFSSHCYSPPPTNLPVTRLDRLVCPSVFALNCCILLYSEELTGMIWCE